MSMKKPVLDPEHVDPLALIASAPASTGACNVVTGDPEPIVVDLCMKKLSELSHERQAAIKKLAGQWLVLKRYGLAGLTIEELEQVIGRLP